MAFAAGVISFLSPCVLPLVPAYISFVSGLSLQSMTEMKGDKDDELSLNRGNRTIIFNSLFFVAGFSLIFVLLGASATWIGSFLVAKISIMTKVGGLIIIFFGLFKIGLFQSLFFNKEAKFQIKDRSFGYTGALLIGASFAFGWTPCIGPILAGILIYASTLKNINQGILLLFVYSMGLGIPFIVTALGVNQFLKFFNNIKKHLGLIEKICGFIMVILGILIFSNKLFLVSGYLTFLNKFAL
jgi:cytochrome c-type biogenesis protein